MFSTYQRLGVNVYASNRTVIRFARQRIERGARKSPFLRDFRHQFYREMLRHHADARRLCIMFRL